MFYETVIDGKIKQTFGYRAFPVVNNVNVHKSKFSQFRVLFYIIQFGRNVKLMHFCTLTGT